MMATPTMDDTTDLHCNSACNYCYTEKYVPPELEQWELFLSDFPETLQPPKENIICSLPRRSRNRQGGIGTRNFHSRP